MKGGAFKKKTQVVNDAGEADAAVEIAGESRKRSGDGGFVSEDGGGGSGESILREMGDDRRTEDGEEEEEEDDEEDDEDGGEDEEDEGKDERPKLDEGYYEIEAIRRKRVRKVSFFFFQQMWLFLWRFWVLLGLRLVSSRWLRILLLLFTLFNSYSFGVRNWLL